MKGKKKKCLSSEAGKKKRFKDLRNEREIKRF